MLSGRTHVLDQVLLFLVDPASENGQQHLPEMKDETHGAPAWRQRPGTATVVGQRRGAKQALRHRPNSHYSQRLLIGRFF